MRRSGYDKSTVKITGDYGDYTALLKKAAEHPKKNRRTAELKNNFLANCV